MLRRDLLRALAAGVATSAALPACRRARRVDGRTVVTLWFAYGGKNREVLLDLVRRFNGSQSRVTVDATYQGDYFEALAKLRTAIAAGAAPTIQVMSLSFTSLPRMTGKAPRSCAIETR